MATSNTITFNLKQQVYFDPKYMIIRQLLYSQIAGADTGTYLIKSDLPNTDYIGAVYLGIQGTSHMPESIITLPDFVQTINFQLVPGHTTFAGPSGLLTMVLEFCTELK
jgi:hypothetical protein